MFLCGQLVLIAVWAKQEGAFAQLRPFFAMTLLFGFAYLCLNTLVLHEGRTYLWKGPILPYLGRLDATVEELSYSLCGVIRLVILLLVSQLFQRLVDHDRFFFLFAEAAPRFVTTALLSIRLVPFLQHEYRRIRETAKLRGLEPQRANGLGQVRYSWLLLRPLLHSALEGAWLTAETLYARGFGSGKRSSYQRMALRPREKTGVLLLLLPFAFALYAKGLGVGQFAFFPLFSWPDPLGDLFGLGCFLLLSIVPIIWFRRGEEM
nr:energy-coupling factor transporter transmembrane component T [Brevibacillus fulvus]